jgi:hypothetical protein
LYTESVKRSALLIVIVVVIAALAIFNIFLNKKSFSGSTQVAPPQENVILPVEASGFTSLDSPDGKLTLLAKTVKNSSAVTHTFSVSGKEIFTITVDPSVTISIPANAWSPDGKYIFLKEEGPAGIKFFALSATTASSVQNDQTANITNLFAAKYPDLKIEDATGWGGVNLIVFNSIKADGSRGPSFWFEMPSHAIIQLSTLF